MAIIYDWYKNTPGAIMPDNPNTDPGMAYWAGQVNSLGENQAYREFLKSIATINAINSGYSGSVTDLENDWKSFENVKYGQPTQVHTDPNNKDSLQTLYSGYGYHINPAWGEAAARGQSVAGIPQYIANNNFGENPYASPPATSSTSTLSGLSNQFQNKPVTNTVTSQTTAQPPGTTLSTLYPRQNCSNYQTTAQPPGTTLSTLYPRQNWSNYQTTNRGSRYFDKNTGRYGLNQNQNGLFTIGF